ncbi:MAG: helix-turn-helix domain-containing protein [Candidatus Aenigmarchaeota archaeon]|nr:helix-turn-helix domain-containing protein [Candidatus Aenigmarchaeota archaeon]
MKPLCEIIVLDYLPVVRAIMAKRMMEKYGLSQKETAKRLGISQPAVSQYKKEVRGAKADRIRGNPEAMKMLDFLSKKLAGGELSQEQASMEFCELCKHIRPNGTDCTIPLHVGH